MNVTNVNILSKARAQTTPISPKPKLYLAISIIEGLGLAIALLKELFDTKINREADIEALGLTILGVTTYTQMFYRPSIAKTTSISVPLDSLRIIKTSQKN